MPLQMRYEPTSSMMSDRNPLSHSQIFYMQSIYVDVGPTGIHMAICSVKTVHLHCKEYHRRHVQHLLFSSELSSS